MILLGELTIIRVDFHRPGGRTVEAKIKSMHINKPEPSHRKSAIGVVIQGPVQSIGRTMKDLHARHFDASENCLDLVKRIKEWGATPILTTWKNQDLKNLSHLNSTDIQKIEYLRISNSWPCYK